MGGREEASQLLVNPGESYQSQVSRVGVQSLVRGRGLMGIVTGVVILLGKKANAI